MSAVLIDLEPIHLDWARKVACWRREAAVLRKRLPGNGATEDYEKALAMDVLGCCGEVAAKLYLNPITWNAYAEKIAGLPDLGDFVDVKTGSKEWHSLIVQKNCPDYWASVLVVPVGCACLRVVGWAWALEAKQTRYWKALQAGRPAYVIEQGDPLLRDPAELLDEVRRLEVQTS